MYYIMLYNSGMIEAKAKIFSGLVKNYANKVLSLDKLANVDWVGTISCSFLWNMPYLQIINKISGNWCCTSIFLTQIRRSYIPTGYYTVMVHRHWRCPFCEEFNYISNIQNDKDDEVTAAVKEVAAASPNTESAAGSPILGPVKQKNSDR